MKKRNLEKATIVEKLKSLLDCDDSESAEIYYSHVNEISELISAKTNFQYLLKVPISRETIKDNGFLLTMPLSKWNVTVYLKGTALMEWNRIE